MPVLSDPLLVEVWLLRATGRIDPHVRLLQALEAACALRSPFSVTSADVREQLPDARGFFRVPGRDSQWDLRSIGQVLSTLADEGKILRVGIFGSPRLQHWLVDPRVAAKRDSSGRA